MIRKRKQICGKYLCLIGIICMLGDFAICAYSLLAEQGSSSDVIAVSRSRNKPASAQTETDAVIWTRSWTDEAKTATCGQKVWANGTDAYTLGYTEEAGTFLKDIFLNHYDASGNLLWSRTFGGSGDEQCGDLWCNGSYIYVVGSSGTYHDGGYFLILLKYDSLGNLVWNKTWGTIYTHQRGLDIYCQGEFIYTVGEYIMGVGANTKVLLMQWNSTGDVQWTKTWGDSVHDYGKAIHGDGTFLYTLGHSELVLAGQKDICVQKWSLDGTLQWGNIFGSSLEEMPNDIWCQDGYFYIVGDYNNSNGVLTMKFDSDCTEIWQNVSRIAFIGEVYGGRGIWSDGEFVYTTGSNLMLKWSLDGQLQWNRNRITWLSGFGIFGVGDTIYTLGGSLIKWDQKNFNPTLTEKPDDSEFEVGGADPTLEWLPSDYDTKNPSYKLLIDGSETHSGSWTDLSEINIKLSAWNMGLGEHNVTLMLLDGAGGITQNSVVMVGRLAWWLMVLVGSVIIVSTVAIALKLKKRK